MTHTFVVIFLLNFSIISHTFGSEKDSRLIQPSKTSIFKDYHDYLMQQRVYDIFETDKMINESYYQFKNKQWSQMPKKSYFSVILLNYPAKPL